MHLKCWIRWWRRQTTYRRLCGRSWRRCWRSLRGWFRARLLGFGEGSLFLRSFFIFLVGGSLDARRGGPLGCAGQRLRSGAFAPDSPRRPPPIVIFVTACGSSFRFPRAYRLPAHPRGPPRRALAMAISRRLGRTVCLGFSPPVLGGGESCGARSRPAARAASGSLRGVLRRVGYRFACGWRCLPSHDGSRCLSSYDASRCYPRRMGGVRSGGPKHTNVCRT